MDIWNLKFVSSSSTEETFDIQDRDVAKELKLNVE